MKRDALRTAALVLILPSLLAGLVRAEQLDLDAVQTAVITNVGQSRVLVGFSSLAEVREEWISTATLSIPLSGAGGRWTIPVEVNGLETGWGAGATWTSPWATPGGDREASLPATTEATLTGASGTLSIDVTDIVRAMAAGDVGENGFVLMPADVQRMGFSGADMALLGSPSQARLTVHYRSLTAMGYRGGPEALLARHRKAEMRGDHPRR